MATILTEAGTAIAVMIVSPVDKTAATAEDLTVNDRIIDATMKTATVSQTEINATGPHIDLDLIFYVAALLPTISCTIRPALHK